MEKHFTILLFIFMVFISDSFAQYQFTVRNYSMGRASTAAAYSIDAIGFNPANIINQRSIDTSIVDFSLGINLGIMLDAEFAPLNLLDQYFTKNADGTKKYLDTDDKNDIIEQVGNTPINSIGNIKPISVVVRTIDGTFGFGVEERVGGHFYFDKDFLEVAFFGNEVNRRYDFSELDFNTSWTRQISFSYARKIDIKNNKNFKYINLGASFKPQLGFYYSEIINNDLSVFTNDSNQISGSGKMTLLYSGISSERKLEPPVNNAGFGVGFDIGLSTTLEDFFNLGKLNLGFSVTDIGYINWKTNAANYYYDGSFLITDITKKEQLDSLEDVINGTRSPIESFSRMLPTTVRIGAQYKYYSNKQMSEGKVHSEDMELMSFALDYIQGFTDNYGGTTTPIVAIGYEINPINELSGRLGIVAGGREKFELSFGLGLNAGPFSMDFGTYNILSVLAPKKTKNFSLGLNMNFKI
ncbi:MAG: DUF5723 family protein [Candidatus Kapaibacterium sp.]